MVEQRTHKPLVGGSNPPSATRWFSAIYGSNRRLCNPLSRWLRADFQVGFPWKGDAAVDSEPGTDQFSGMSQGRGRGGYSARLLWNLVEGVIGVGVPEGAAVGRFNAFGIQMVDVAADEAVDFKPHGFLIERHGGGDDFGGGVVNFRAAISVLKDVGPSLHRVAFRIGRGRGIDRLSEIEGEAVGVSGHGFDFKGGFTRPFDAFEGEGLVTSGRPAAVRSSGEEDGGFLVEFDGDRAGLETFEEMENRALIEAIDLFETDALDLGVALLADIELVVPRAEFSIGHVASDAGG